MIEKQGEAFVGYAQIQALCADEVVPRSEWELIAKIAINQGWSFTFLPDRTVRFAKL